MAVDPPAEEGEQDQRREGGAEAGPGEEHEPEHQPHLGQRDEHAEEAHHHHRDPPQQQAAAVVAGAAQGLLDDVVGDRRRRHQQLRRDRGEDGRDHGGEQQAGQHGVDQLERQGHQGLLAVGEVGQHHPADQAHQPRPVEHRQPPRHGDQLQPLHLAVVARRHVAGDDVRHAGVAEADAELADHEAPQGGPDAVAARGQEPGVDGAEARDQGPETAEAGDGIERQRDQGARHQEALEEVGPGHRPEAAERGDGGDHDGADDHPQEVAAAALEPERGRKGLARGGHLRRHVAHHADQDDRGGGDPQNVLRVAPAAGDDIGERDRTVSGGQRPQPRRHDVDVDQVAEQTTGRVPQARHAVHEGHADRAERDPTGLGARGRRDPGRPGAERAAGEVEVLAAVGAPRGLPADDEEDAEIGDHHRGDRGHG